MVKPVQYGRVERISYSKINEVLDIPDLVEIQKSSYQWFLNEGIREVLDGISPIRDFSGDIELTFLKLSLIQLIPVIRWKSVKSVMQIMLLQCELW